MARFARIVEYVEHPPTLRCAGDEDRTTQARRRPALARAIKAPSDLTIDLAELAWADASLMLDFMMLARRLRANGCAVSLCRAQPQIVALIELVGLDRLPGVHLDRATAPATPDDRTRATALRTSVGAPVRVAGL